MKRIRRNVLYLLLYVSGAYGLVLSPPIEYAVSFLPRWRSEMPLALKCALAVITADVLAYWIHRAAHRYPLMWRFHRVHHSGGELGPLTTFRFHAAEIAWRMLGAAIPLHVLGIQAWSFPALFIFAPLVFQVLAHSDLDWSFELLGRVLVSPAWHSRHHHRAAGNYSMTFSVWDELFGTRAA